MARPKQPIPLAPGARTPLLDYSSVNIMSYGEIKVGTSYYMASPWLPIQLHKTVILLLRCWLRLAKVRPPLMSLG